jgi:uncharacterized protein
LIVDLLDINVLIALAWPQHIHHAQAHRWFDAVGRAVWATCPLTQPAFIRISSNHKMIPEAVGPREAVATLARITALPGHHFWPDEPAPVELPIFSSLALMEQRQVTDAYLYALARHHKGKLATFDGGWPRSVLTTSPGTSSLLDDLDPHQRSKCLTRPRLPART